MVDWTIFLSPKLPLFSTKFVNIITLILMYNLPPNSLSKQKLFYLLPKDPFLTKEIFTPLKNLFSQARLYGILDRLTHDP